jgi:hypothetical protein
MFGAVAAGSRALDRTPQDVLGNVTGPGGAEEQLVQVRGLQCGSVNAP